MQLDSRAPYRGAFGPPRITNKYFVMESGLLAVMEFKNIPINHMLFFVNQI